MPLNRNRIIHNLGYAFTAQMLSFVVSAILALVVPKLIGIEAFSYWQLFIFYVSYGWYIHFGLTDGIYLRYGGQNYSDMNYSLLGSQYKYSVVLQVSALLLLCIIVVPYLTPDRAYVLISSCVVIIIWNICSFFSFLLQAVNKVKFYSLSIVLERLIFIGEIILFFIFDVESYKILIVLFAVGRLSALCFLSFICKEIIVSKLLPFKEVISEMWKNITIGLSLTISGLASFTILGIGRIVVDINCGIVEFGKVSFAILMVNFFISFLYQFGLVLFPELRQLQKSEITDYYYKLDVVFSLISPGILVFTPLFLYLIKLWLPSYEQSAYYLMILMPFLGFEGKMQLLHNTFLKVSREEKRLLLFSAIACLISIVLSVLSMYIFHSILLVVLSMVVSIAARSIIAECFLFKKYHIDDYKIVVTYFSLMLLYLIAYIILTTSQACIIYMISYLSVILINKSRLKVVLLRLKK